MKKMIVLIMVSMLFLGCSPKEKHYKYASIDQNLTLADENIKELAMRFMQYWDAVSRHDFNTSYQMELPYIQFVKPYDDYTTEGNAQFEHFYVTLKKVECLDGNCTTALLQREYRFKKKILSFKSKWIKVNGTWYHRYDFSLFPQGH